MQPCDATTDLDLINHPQQSHAFVLFESQRHFSRISAVTLVVSYVSSFSSSYPLIEISTSDLHSSFQTDTDGRCVDYFCANILPSIIKLEQIVNACNVHGEDEVERITTE